MKILVFCYIFESLVAHVEIITIIVVVVVVVVILLNFVS